jgi:hypothetical protein
MDQHPVLTAAALFCALFASSQINVRRASRPGIITVKLTPTPQVAMYRLAPGPVRLTRPPTSATTHAHRRRASSG